MILDVLKKNKYIFRIFLKLKRSLDVPFYIYVYLYYLYINIKYVDNIKLNKSSDLVVIIHIHYYDGWEDIKQKLLHLNYSFDLIVTVSSKNDIKYQLFVHDITKNFKHVTILHVPNLGRDVLPFLEVIKLIRNIDYKYILKLHSKKSIHRKDGDLWRTAILNNLIPNKNNIQDNLLKKLKLFNTGIIGPKQDYLKLKVNLAANKGYLYNILLKIIKDRIEVDLILNKKVNDYGFYSGTMFWTKLDILNNLNKDILSIHKFHREKGQIDGTYAHAIERVISLYVEIGKYDVYSSTDKDILKINYDEGIIPAWFKNKNTKKINV